MRRNLAKQMAVVKEGQRDMQGSCKDEWMELDECMWMGCVHEDRM